jgi:hypothetical protein
VPDEVNLDTGTAITFVSEGSFVRHQLKTFVQGKSLVMTQTAVSELQRITAVFAGPAEQARLLRFLSRVRIIPDSPSARAQALRLTNDLGANDVVILGTGDQLGIVTMTTDRKAVRAARVQGAAFAVHVHQPIPFTGK